VRKNLKNGTSLFEFGSGLVLVGLGTTVLTSSSGGDETDLSSSGGRSADGGRLSDVLMVTTTVGMLDGVHGHTSHLGPAVSLGLVFVVGISGLQHRLIESTSASHDSNACSAVAGNNLVSRTGWHFQSGNSLFPQVGEDNGVGSRGSAKLSSVTRLFLDVAHVRTFRHVSQRKAVSNTNISLLSAENELSGEHALDGDHVVLLFAISFLVEVFDNSKRGSTSRIVNNIHNLSLHIFLDFRRISRSKLGGLFA